MQATLAAMDPVMQIALTRFCYIFPAVGMKDLRLAFDGDTVPVNKMYFIQSVFPPLSDNNFYAFDAAQPRHKRNSGIVMALEKKLRENGGVIHLGDVSNPTVIRAFLSMAHSGRTLMEMRMCVDAGCVAPSFQACRNTYERVIRLSFDVAASKVLDMVKKNPDQITIIAINNDKEHERAIPELTRRIVSEALAGMSMIAVHENKPYAAVSYATASLFRHPEVLPMINCVRLMAVVKGMNECVVGLTDTVILPFFLMSAKEHPDLYKLHVKELRQWPAPLRTELLKHARVITAQALSFKERFYGKFGVARARLEDGKFVEKLCAVCGVGYLGEKIFKCSGCSEICYCSKDCQEKHWPEHKIACAKA